MCDRPAEGWRAGCPTRAKSRAAQISRSIKEKESMSILKTVTTTIFGLALLGVVLSPGAKADEWNRKTTMTFSGPVEIPGVHLKGWAVLPAGTYVFRSEEHTSE